MVWYTHYTEELSLSGLAPARSGDGKTMRIQLLVSKILQCFKDACNVRRVDRDRGTAHCNKRQDGFIAACSDCLDVVPMVARGRFHRVKFIYNNPCRQDSCDISLFHFFCFLDPLPKGGEVESSVQVYPQPNLCAT